MRGAVGGEIGPAEVVPEDDQQIGALAGGGGACREGAFGRGGVGGLGGGGRTGDGGHRTATDEPTEGTTGYFGHAESLVRKAKEGEHMARGFHVISRPTSGPGIPPGVHGAETLPQPTTLSNSTARAGIVIAVPARWTTPGASPCSSRDVSTTTS
ncbi:hypothetical protein SALBM311S_07322 [Streptomyces alboniger]